MYKLKLPESIRILKIVRLLAAVFFFIAVFLAFLKVNLWDYDFWWHIATGRYIVTEGHLPEKDIFSYTSGLEENKNPFPVWEKFVLKQYWLSQIIFYLIYDYAGAKGIVLLRSILLVATLLVVFWRLWRWSVSFPISFVFIFVLFTAMSPATGERPVLFTILFTAIVFFILEDFKDKRDKRIFLLAPLMLLWANLHGGFVIGIIIISVYVLGEGVKLTYKKSSYTKQEILLFYAASILAVGCSFLNPAGWDVVFINISSRYKPIFEGVQEYMPPFFIYKNNIAPIDKGFLFLLIILPVILIFRNKKVELNHMILLSGTLIMGLSALRFTIYYAIIAAMILGKESDAFVKDLLQRKFSEEKYQKILAGLTVAVLISSIIFIAGFLKPKNLMPDMANSYSVPKAAVDFINNNKLSGNMFNNYGYGGYISWRLYPRQKTFIDTRALNLTVITEYDWIFNAIDFTEKTDASIATVPLWERLLKHYKINFVFLPLFDIYGQISPLIFKLAGSEKWAPVYCDPVSIIFTRDNELNKEVIEKYKLSNEKIYNTIVYEGSANAIVNKINPRSLISLGETFYRMGRLNNAITAYKYALKRMPESFALKERLMQIESENKRNKDAQ